MRLCSNHNLLSLRLYIVQLYIMYIYIVPLSSATTVNEALPKTERPVAMLRRKKKQRLYSHPFADGNSFHVSEASLLHRKKKSATLVFGGFRMCFFLPPKQSERSKDQTKFPPKWMCGRSWGRFYLVSKCQKNDGSYTTPCLRFLAPATIQDPPVPNCESGPAPSWRVVEVFVHALFLALQIE